ncbi:MULTISPECIES: hypothetical protein [Acinetobacter]|uniref:hypothetical protein n=1 Tax=Acinetobacter TaxID=469 RepID=UPI0015D3D89F|nr:MULTISPECIES: hypothetical protein [Acinetobacter]
MGYIVKLIPEEVYFVPNDHEIGMTESREKAIVEGLFFEYANERWSHLFEQLKAYL